jgi:drug/metabolite transporter (DMT)-like permease
LGVLVVIGMYFVFTFEGQYLTAILVGLLGALLASIFSVMNVHLSKKYDAQTVTFYEMLGAFLSSIVYIPFMLFFIKDLDFQWIMSAQDWFWIGVLGLVCTVYPYNEMMKLLKKFSAFTLNLSINMEPIYGIILAYLIFGEKEKMTNGFYIGGLLILASVFLHPLLGRMAKK